jgi:transcriptional regulator with XRE-family HTH domain
MATLGERLRLLRNEQKFGQKVIAGLLKVSVSTIGKYENDQRTPSPNTINKLADFFKVSTDYLLGRSEIRNPVIFTIMSGLPEEAKEKIEEYIIFINQQYTK